MNIDRDIYISYQKEEGFMSRFKPIHSKYLPKLRQVNLRPDGHEIAYPSGIRWTVPTKRWISLTRDEAINLIKA